MWGTKRTTNYLPVSLWGLSWCFMPLYLCSVSHISQQELVEAEEEEEKKLFSLERGVLRRYTPGFEAHSPIQVYL